MSSSILIGHDWGTLNAFIEHFTAPIIQRTRLDLRVDDLVKRSGLRDPIQARYLDNLSLEAQKDRFEYIVERVITDPVYDASFARIFQGSNVYVKRELERKITNDIKAVYKQLQLEPDAVSSQESFLRKWESALVKGEIQGMTLNEGELVSDSHEVLGTGLCWGRVSKLRMQFQRNPEKTITAADLAVKPEDRFLHAQHMVRVLIYSEIEKKIAIDQNVLKKYGFNSEYQDQSYATISLGLKNATLDDFNQVLSPTFTDASAGYVALKMLGADEGHGILIRADHSRGIYLVYDSNLGLYDFSFMNYDSLLTFLTELMDTMYPTMDYLEFFQIAKAS